MQASALCRMLEGMHLLPVKFSYICICIGGFMYESNGFIKSCPHVYELKIFTRLEIWQWCGIFSSSLLFVVSVQFSVTSCRAELTIFLWWQSANFFFFKFAIRRNFLLCKGKRYSYSSWWLLVLNLSEIFIFSVFVIPFLYCDFQLTNKVHLHGQSWWHRWKMWRAWMEKTGAVSTLDTGMEIIRVIFLWWDWGRSWITWDTINWWNVLS